MGLLLQATQQARAAPNPIVGLVIVICLFLFIFSMAGVAIYLGQRPRQLNLRLQEAQIKYYSEAHVAWQVNQKHTERSQQLAERNCAAMEQLASAMQRIATAMEQGKASGLS